MGSKSVKVEEEQQDRISDLPDCLIHHMLSFLPSRWQNQWTRVPVLIFNYTGISCENSHNIIDNILNLQDCSKIKKFHLDHPCSDDKDPRITAKIGFATRKHVEDLSLTLSQHVYTLPEFLFDNASLVKLTIQNCTLMPNGRVNWECLTELGMYDCKLPDQAMEHILSGSPLLKSLELIASLSQFDKLIIVSKSLKRFLCHHNAAMGFVYSDRFISAFEISCPNLEELSLNLNVVTICYSKLVTQAIKNVVSCSLLLESFDLNCDGISGLVIASESLKRLALGHLTDVEISCPNLEKLIILNDLGRVGTVKLLNLSSLLCATIDFYGPEFYGLGSGRRMIFQIKKVKKVLSKFVSMGDLFLPVLDIKCLILYYSNTTNPKFGITCVLRNSHVLEKLVINVPHYDQKYYNFLKQTDFGKNYWNSNERDFDCLSLHLKTIMIIGCPEEVVLTFVKFLLKNARVLEKMVVEFKDHVTTSKMAAFERGFMRLPRCSKNCDY
ncbi:putative F-box/LRR-repeat protein At5g02930 [Euphorbia lathyris]|uniref:putative F-box/LRR-repeat protein At5g02930 n=1 Tax=Euphorbia lathyris TaxID=212925 RepID=UPI00331349AC